MIMIILSSRTRTPLGPGCELTPILNVTQIQYLCFGYECYFVVVLYQRLSPGSWLRTCCGWREKWLVSCCSQACCQTSISWPYSGLPPPNKNFSSPKVGKPFCVTALRWSECLPLFLGSKVFILLSTLLCAFLVLSKTDRQTSVS